MNCCIACKSCNQNPFPKGGIQQKASQEISLTREISPVPFPEQNLPISAGFVSPSTAAAPHGGGDDPSTALWAALFCIFLFLNLVRTKASTGIRKMPLKKPLQLNQHSQTRTISTSVTGDILLH